MSSLDTALIDEVFLDDIVGVALISELDVYAGIEERLLAQTALEHLVLINRCFLEDLGVSLETNLCTLDIGLADFFEVVHDLAALVTLEIHVLAVANLDLEPLGKRVNNRCAYAVQTARYLVTAAAELAARVEHGENDCNGRQTRLAVNSYGDTASVVGDADNVARLDNDVYL